MAHGVVADTFEAFSGMAAGHGQAVDLARPLLCGIVEGARAGYARAILRQHLDDLAPQVEGARQRIRDTMSKIAKLVQVGIDLLQIPFSSKTAAVAQE